MSTPPSSLEWSAYQRVHLLALRERAPGVVGPSPRPGAPELLPGALVDHLEGERQGLGRGSERTRGERENPGFSPARLGGMADRVVKTELKLEDKMSEALAHIREGFESVDESVKEAGHEIFGMLGQAGARWQLGFQLAGRRRVREASLGHEAVRRRRAPRGPGEGDPRGLAADDRRGGRVPRGPRARGPRAQRAVRGPRGHVRAVQGGHRPGVRRDGGAHGDRSLKDVALLDRRDGERRQGGPGRASRRFARAGSRTSRPGSSGPATPSSR